MPEIIKLNSTNPAAPAGSTNVKWQEGAQDGTDPATGLPIFPVTAYVEGLGDALAALNAQPVDVAITYNGKPANSTVLVRHIFPFNVTIPAGCTNSSLFSEVAATADSTFSLTKNGVQFATAVISAGGTTAVFTCATDTSFVAGTDVLRVISPSTADTTLADLGGTIYGTR